MNTWDLFRRKSAADVLGEGNIGNSLKRTLVAFDITMLGVGAVIGAGIFASFGQAAAGGDGLLGAGPALMLSYLLTAVACGFAAMCYAEIAAMVPIAGSAYTYSYIAFGEVVAWIIGWDLTIEYAVGNIYVAASWADYLRSFLRGTLGVDFPAWLATDPKPPQRKRPGSPPWRPYRRLRGRLQPAGPSSSRRSSASCSSSA
jgi:APA family basic amino acid/polyamine antiporter